ncbi:MAG: enoyl-CoA hydratase [Gammaproteobacteria bacterium]|jgi:enoyl-CoA hydratase/carnithine racemase|nr:enoyl-CoA hydratase [Gammaproteobacteria bacterium]
MSEALDLGTEKLLAHVDERGIGWIVFNQPERHNALSLAMWQGLAGALSSFAARADVRIAVMRGAGGKAFVSGADISEFDTKRANAAQKEEYGRVAGEANRWLARFDKPLIALIEGYCIGGGLATALAADIRFASPDSRFGIPAARLGLGYEYEGLAKLARIVGPSRARDIMFSARFMEAEEALAMGLINFVVSRERIEAEVVEYASRIAGNAPLTVKAAKAAINAFERGSREEDVERVRELVDACFDSDDYREGRRAFAAKRPPQFEGR